MDSQFVDKIVNEVKAQGVFDQFRRECMSDCDTKPAYQNLRQRVENSVSRFLSDQKWKPEMNKNQLREKLRKHIADGRFLETGVERIVDQVVLPKISTIFQPKIEDIVYKYLGIEKLEPKYDEEKVQPVNNYQNGNLAIKTNLLATDHLEEVSPDSEKSNIKNAVKQEVIEEEEDDESPPFEPLVEDAPKLIKNQTENSLSGLSGLTSQSPADIKKENAIKEEDEKQINVSGGDNTQESQSQLSEVSSNSRLSIDEDEDAPSPKKEMEKPKVDICEEAQMPKFHENSNSCPPISTEPLHFDIKKDEIKFEGTDRNMEYDSIKPEDIIVPQIPPPPPPPPPEPVCIPPPPIDKTEESFYDDDSEKALQIVEETQTKDDSDVRNIGDHITDVNDDLVRLETEEERNLNCTATPNKKEKFEDQSSLDPSSSKKLELISGQIENLHNKSNEVNNIELSPSKLLVSTTKSIAEPESKESSRHVTSHKKHSKDRKSDKERDKGKYRSSSKSSNSDKKVNSTDKHSSHSRYSSSKDQKFSNKDISSSYHHKSKNEKHSSETKDKSRSERDKKRSRDKNSDDHSSSRNKYSRRKSTDSEDGGDKKESLSGHKLNVSSKRSSDKNKSNNYSKHEAENYSKEKSNSNNDEKAKSNNHTKHEAENRSKELSNTNNDAKAICGEIIGNDLEKIEFVLGIQRSDVKVITKKSESNNELPSVNSGYKDSLNETTRKTASDDVVSLHQEKLDSKDEFIVPEQKLETDAMHTSDNEEELKYFIITSDEKNEYENLVKASTNHLKSSNEPETSNQMVKVNEPVKRKLSPDHFENKNLPDTMENKEKKPKTNVKSERKSSPSQQQETSLPADQKLNTNSPSEKMFNCKDPEPHENNN